LKITVEKITPHSWIDQACQYTSGKSDLKVDVNKMYRAEHSPIRTQIFAVHMLDIPTYVSTHFVRHKMGVEHFVKSNRRAKESVERNTPVNHMMLLNAQALISMARVRLCNKADKVAQQVMRCIVGQLVIKDKALAEYLVPNCLYRNGCPEMKPCDNPPEWSW